MSRSLTDIRDEMEKLLLNFPSPRNQPLEAIEAKERIRELKAEYDQCLKERPTPAQNRDALG